eukprot:g432.t1
MGAVLGICGCDEGTTSTNFAVRLDQGNRYTDFMREEEKEEEEREGKRRTKGDERGCDRPLLLEQFDWQGETCEVKQLDPTKTIRPQKRHTKGSKRWTLHQKIYKTLQTKEVNFKQLAKLPDFEDCNEWLAVNTIDFYNEIVLLHGVITELCTKRTCPVMNAGRKFTYLWADGDRFKSPIKCSAPQYIYYLLEWVDRQISDERIIPADGVSYRPDFMKRIKIIFKRLFRVFAHIYHRHYGEYHQLGVSPNLNNSFKRFILFVLEFDLISKEHLAPLQKLIALATETSDAVSA